MTDTAAAIRAEMLSVWEADARPWVVGFSGGKDSTCVVQLAWGALQGAKRRKALHVIASDTLVENPAVVAQLASSLGAMEAAARPSGMDIRTNLVSPVTKDTFWSCMLGRGMPAPTRNSRWCTDRLKIDSADRYIRDVVSASGGVVMVLGTRKAESSLRRMSMDAREEAGGGSLLNPHGKLRGADVYTPIRDLGAEDVWGILLSEKNPWGADNGELARIYRKANGGECPLVVDRSSPSCGNSRFGCWTCTVVDKDFSLENIVRDGEAWMQPLVDFRNEIKDTQRRERWPGCRGFRRANGRYALRRRGFEPGAEPHKQLVPGPYTWDYVKSLARRLMRMEAELRESGHPMELVSDAEAEEIQRWWRIRHGDWAGALRPIWAEGGRRPMPGAEAWAARDAAMGELCRERGLDPTFMRRLVSIVAESPTRRRMRTELRYLADFDERTDLAEVVRDLRARADGGPPVQRVITQFAGGAA